VAEVGPYSPVGDHRVPHANGHMFRWLRGQPQSSRADFVLGVAATDLPLGLELARRVELRGADLRRVLARGFDLEISAIRHWLGRCLSLLGSDGLLGFLEELALAEPERAARAAYWLVPALYHRGLDDYHRASVERLFQQLAGAGAFGFRFEPPKQRRAEPGSVLSSGDS
jgi:hypothetical protein